MLRLFGIPYITAPMEAEAQCAALLSLGLVDGIITDDSDVFLFGGARVLKNMFNQSKTVECFLLSDLERELGLVEEAPPRRRWRRGRRVRRERYLSTEAAEVHAEVRVRGTLLLLLAEAVDEGGDGHGERGRVGVAGDLDLELGRDAAACFFTQDLLTGDPAILVDEVDPALEDL